MLTSAPRVLPTPVFAGGLLRVGRGLTVGPTAPGGPLSPAVPLAPAMPWKPCRGAEVGVRPQAPEDVAPPPSGPGSLWSGVPAALDQDQPLQAAHHPPRSSAGHPAQGTAPPALPLQRFFTTTPLALFRLCPVSQLSSRPGVAPAEAARDLPTQGSMDPLAGENEEGPSSRPEAHVLTHAPMHPCLPVGPGTFPPYGSSAGGLGPPTLPRGGQKDPRWAPQGSRGHLQGCLHPGCGLADCCVHPEEAGGGAYPRAGGSRQASAPLQASHSLRAEEGAGWGRERWAPPHTPPAASPVTPTSDRTRAPGHPDTRPLKPRHPPPARQRAHAPPAAQAAAPTALSELSHLWSLEADLPGGALVTGVALEGNGHAGQAGAPV